MQIIHSIPNVESDQIRAGQTGPEQAFLKLVGISRYYKTIPAVRQMDLAVQEGEYITLLGPSGCGKTTTLRMIAGFIPPSSGQILLDGRDIVSLPPEKRPVNMVFQDYALFPHLTVQQNVEYGLRVRGVPNDERKRRVMEMLELVQLASLASRYPRYLSGGQQQRVALARALVCQPRLLLLDEPLGALDAKLREQMQTVLKGLQRALKIAFIHVTHDQAEALALSDRIVVMRAGVVMQTGSPDQLYHKPSNTFVADFLGTTNLLAGVILEQAGTDTTMRIAGQVIRARTQSPIQTGEKVYLSVRPSALRIDQDTSSGNVNRMSAKVISSVYRGEHWIVSAQAGELTLLASINESLGKDLQPGDAIQLTWAAEDGWLMREES